MLFNQDACYYADAIKDGRMSVRQVVQAAIDNIDRYNSRLNAVVSSYPQESLDLAESFDFFLNTLPKNQRKNLPPFFGVPILLKDLGQAEAGRKSTSGAKILKDHSSKADDNFSLAVKRLGFICIGRTNVPEFGFKNISDSQTTGPVNSPLDLERNPGGSSGGAAAALKAGLVPMVAASDGGGSIRIPASFTGLIGLKPSRGRMPIGPKVHRVWQGAAVDFFLTRSIRDTWQLLKYMQVEQIEAPFILPKIQEKDLLPPVKPFKLVYSYKTPLGQPISQPARKALDQAIIILKGLGHQVTEVDFKFDGRKLMASYYRVNGVETAVMFGQIEKRLGRSLSLEDMEAMTWAIYQSGLKVSAKDYAETLAYWDAISAEMSQVFRDYDFILSPTADGPAPLQGEFDLDPSLLDQIRQIERLNRPDQEALIWQLFEPALALTPYTQAANLIGQPSISLPMAKTDQGLPIGIQVTANKGQDYQLLQLGGQLELAGFLDSRIVDLG